MNLKHVAIAAFSYLAIAASPAAAITTIDFTNGAEPDGVTVSSLAGGAVNYSQAFDGLSPGASYCQDLGPLACAFDGFGIGDDEIEADRRTEAARVTFDNGPTRVLGIHFFDMFTSTNGSELARFELFDTGGATLLKSELRANDPADDSGYAYADFGTGIAGVSYIEFWARSEFRSPCTTDSCTDDGNNDFAVAGISVVPLPASAFLLLAGIGGMAAMRRRKKA
ncbi:MAG: VPLPA-CTERM sorting domain-containing protein [Tateyamaria sp.]|uniref:VPLPA-CTERM sorting domain-containing protein n=1 Tax=Tateyamaria sp. TaxID=1929288 RepID=UPI0032878F4C